MKLKIDLKKGFCCGICYRVYITEICYEHSIGSADCEKLELALLSMSDIDVCEY